MAVISKDLGAITAYAAAVNRGYTGTKEEFETLMASYATVARQAAESAGNASQSATNASQSAQNAETAKGTAQQAATDAQTAQASAQESAQSAQQSAQSASQSATDAESAKNTAVDAVDGFAAGAQQALDDVNQAGNNWKSLAQAKALDSEAYALGTRDGEDVGSSDPAYHNNAKYYAESVSASAQTATEAAQTATQKAGEAAQSASAAAESARTLTIDATLTQAGQAADSKAVGDGLRHVEAEFENSFVYEKSTKPTVVENGAVLIDGTISTNGAWANVYHKSYEVTSEDVYRQFLLSGYTWFALQPFVFVGTSGKIEHSNFPNPGNTHTLYEDIKFIPKEEGTIYVNSKGRSLINNVAIRSTYIYDFKDSRINTLQEKPYNLTTPEYLWETSKAIDNTGVVRPLISTNEHYVVSVPIDVVGYSKVYVSGKANYTNSYFAFYDINDDVLFYKHEDESQSKILSFDDLVSIPKDAKWLRVATYIDVIGGTIPKPFVQFPVYSDIDLSETIKSCDTISEILEPVYELGIGTTENGKILNDNGHVSDYATGVLLTASVTPGERIEITGESYNANYYYSLFDSNDRFITGAKGIAGEGFTKYENIIVTIPPFADKIRVSGRTSTIPLARKADRCAIKKWKGKKWVVVGDSLTEHNGSTTLNYHDYISAETGIEVVNMGDGGSGYRKEQNLNTAFYQRILNVPTDADVVTIFGSFNDGITDIGTADDTGTTTIGGCVNTTIDNLYSVIPTVQLGIVSPTPWRYSNPYDHASANAYADLLEAICKKRSIPFLNLYYESNLRPWDASFRELAYSKDEGNGVHPDETGHKLIAPRFKAFLETLLM